MTSLFPKLKKYLSRDHFSSAGESKNFTNEYLDDNLSRNIRGRLAVTRADEGMDNDVRNGKSFDVGHMTESLEGVAGKITNLIHRGHKVELFGAEGRRV